MIKIEFAFAISLLISFSLCLVFIKWLFYTYYENKNVDTQSNYFQQCPFCTYIYFDYHKDQIKMCPRCKSLVAKNDEE